VAHQTARMARPSLLVLDDHRHVGLTAAELVANRIRARTHMRLLLPTGHTPLGLYRALRDHAADGSLPTDHVTVLGLDEYLGLGRDDPRSFRAALDRQLAGLRIGGARRSTVPPLTPRLRRPATRQSLTPRPSTWRCSGSDAMRMSPSTSPARVPMTGFGV
jgi:6-phosphogluconolactonase/glucosamine-6-phosphate isomerase/deaminase